MHCFQCPLITHNSFVLLITPKRLIILLHFNSNTQFENGVTCKTNSKQSDET